MKIKIIKTGKTIEVNEKKAAQFLGSGLGIEVKDEPKPAPKPRRKSAKK